MSTNGSEKDNDPFAQFSENELLKFERLLTAEEANKKSQVKTLKLALTPDEDDKYDAYVRVVLQERQKTTGHKALTPHYKSNKKDTTKEDPTKEDPSDSKKKPGNGCNIM